MLRYTVFIQMNGQICDGFMTYTATVFSIRQIKNGSDVVKRRETQLQVSKK